MKISCDDKTALVRKYVPFPLGNGELSFQIDCEGGMKQVACCGMIPMILRAGYRYDNDSHSLVPFGYFNSEIEGAGELREWTQSVDLESGLCRTLCFYENGIQAETEIFCHLEQNVIAIRKKITGGGVIPGSIFATRSIPSGWRSSRRPTFA